jgi:hypothetical protein
MGDRYEVRKGANSEKIMSRLVLNPIKGTSVLVTRIAPGITNYIFISLPVKEQDFL